MNKLFTRATIISFVFFFNFNIAQINNKIEGISFHTPCEIEYIRNIQNQNHYNCYYQDNSNYFHDYSITVSNLFNDLNGLSESGVSAYKEEFLKTIKQNSIKEGVILSEYIELSNGTKALLTISSLNFQGTKFTVYSIYFIYRQKHFAVNHTTNLINRDFSKYNLNKRILFD